MRVQQCALSQNIRYSAFQYKGARSDMSKVCFEFQKVGLEDNICTTLLVSYECILESLGIVYALFLDHNSTIYAPFFSNLLMALCA